QPDKPPHRSSLSLLAMTDAGAGPGASPFIAGTDMSATGDFSDLFDYDDDTIAAAAAVTSPFHQSLDLSKDQSLNGFNPQALHNSTTASSTLGARDIAAAESPDSLNDSTTTFDAITILRQPDKPPHRSSLSLLAMTDAGAGPGASPFIAGTDMSATGDFSDLFDYDDDTIAAAAAAAAVTSPFHQSLDLSKDQSLSGFNPQALHNPTRASSTLGARDIAAAESPDSLNDSFRDSSSDSGSSKRTGSSASGKTALTAGDIMMTDGNDIKKEWNSTSFSKGSDDGTFIFGANMPSSVMGDNFDLPTDDNFMNDSFDFESASSSPEAANNAATNLASPDMPTMTAHIPRNSQTPSKSKSQAHRKKSQFPLTQPMHGLHMSASREVSPLSQNVASQQASPSNFFNNSPSPTNQPDFSNHVTAAVGHPFWPQVDGGHAAMPPGFPMMQQFHPQLMQQMLFAQGGFNPMPYHCKLIIHPTPTKSRVETQIPIKMTLLGAPPGVKRLHLPTHTISKPKLLAKSPSERSPDMLELYTQLVCTSAMLVGDNKQRAFKRAAAASHPHPSLNERSASEDSNEEDKPQNGGEVRICQGCITRERKRAGRKKIKKVEEEEMWKKDENRRTPRLQARQNLSILHRFVAGLLARGANPDLRDKGGFTPMHMAAINDHEAIVRRLMQAGADPTIRSLSGLRPADVARSRKVIEHIRRCERHVRSRSGGSLHSRASSAASLRSLWDPHAVSEESDDPGDGEESPEYSSGDFESEDEAEDNWLNMRRSSTHAYGAPTERDSLSEERDELQRVPGSPTTALAAAVRDQVSAQLHQFQQAMAMHFPNMSQMPNLPQMPNFPRMSMLPDYQQYLHQHPLMGRMTSFMEGMSGSRPGSAGDETPKAMDGKWWDFSSLLNNNNNTASPPAYTELYPQDALDKKQASAAGAAAEAEADAKCAKLFDTATAEAIEETSEAATSEAPVPKALMIGRKKAMTKEQQQDFLRAHAAKFKGIRSDKNLWFIWIPLLTVLLASMLYIRFPEHFATAWSMIRSVPAQQVPEAARNLRDRVVEVL
ncbi:hypothetical protein BN1723_009148, partial [Verticillium longisporum]